MSTDIVTTVTETGSPYSQRNYDTVPLPDVASQNWQAFKSYTIIGSL